MGAPRKQAFTDLKAGKQVDFQNFLNTINKRKEELSGSPFPQKAQEAFQRVQPKLEEAFSTAKQSYADALAARSSDMQPEQSNQQAASFPTAAAKPAEQALSAPPFSSSTPGGFFESLPKSREEAQALVDKLREQYGTRSQPAQKPVTGRR